MRNPCLPIAVATMCSLTLGGVTWAAEQRLVDFSPPFDVAKVATTDAVVSLTGTGGTRALRIATGTRGP